MNNKIMEDDKLEEKSEIPQHVQLPNRSSNESITPREQLVYIAIKRCMNRKSLEAFPSLKTLSTYTGASIPTIRDAIKILVDLNYLSVHKEGRKHVYKFNPYKQFEPFSYEFLDRKDLSFLEKSYLVASQQFMFKDGEDGSISYSNRELADKINMSIASISRCNKSLEAKEFLTTVQNESRDSVTGVLTDTKIFHLNKFGQAVVGILMNHENRITENSEEIKTLKDQMQQTNKKNELLEREVAKLKEQLKELTTPKIIL